MITCNPPNILIYKEERDTKCFAEASRQLNCSVESDFQSAEEVTLFILPL